MGDVAVISDIHADSGALRAILDGISARGVTRIWCLGDFASGGPDPAGAAELVLSRCEIALAGNHEGFLIARIWESLDGGFARAAAHAAAQLTAEQISAISRLSPHALTGHAQLVHGSLQDPASGFLGHSRRRGPAFPPAAAAAAAAARPHSPGGLVGA